MHYHRHTLAVPGGSMTVGEWTPDGLDEHQIAALPTVVAVHGIGSQHLAWSRAAHYTSGVRIIAPDLRGGAGSRDLPGPWGLEVHVQDLLEVCARFGVQTAIGAGHSLGAFVLLLAATKRPALFDGTLFIDGGFPVAVPLAISDPEHMDRLARERNSDFERMEFESIEQHRAFWRTHPAVHEWDEVIEAYVDNDLVEIEGTYRWSTQPAALEQDTRELFGSFRFWSALHNLRIPVTLIAARRGLFDEDDGIYSSRQLEAITRQHPWVRIVRADSNHFMNLLSRAGGARIANELAQLRIVADLDPKQHGYRTSGNGGQAHRGAADPVQARAETDRIGPHESRLGDSDAEHA